MIEFSGELSPRCQNYIRKYDNRHAIFGGLFSYVIALPVAIGMFVHMIQDKFSLAAILIITALMLFVLVLLPLANVKSKKEFAKMLPQRITIEDDGSVTLHRARHPIEQVMENVKDVRDYGDFYDINFALIGVTGLFVCQKDLLTEGSIEEFERIFEKKIIRMKA